MHDHTAIQPCYVPDLGDPIRFPMDWRDEGHWLLVKGFRPVAVYHGGYFATPREVFADFVARFTHSHWSIVGEIPTVARDVETDDPGFEPPAQPSYPDSAWGDHGWGCGFAIFRNGQPRAAWVEDIGFDHPERHNFHAIDGMGCVTITGRLSGSIDGLHPLPDGWPSRLDLIQDGQILLPDPMAIPPRAVELLNVFGKMMAAKSAP